MKQHYFWMTFLYLVFTFPLSLVAQNVGINDDNSTPDANAMLDVKSTTKGALFPRMTTAQRTTLGALNPTEGMLVFDTDIEAYFYFTNSAWAQLSTGTGSAIPIGTILIWAGHIDNANDGGYNSAPYSPVPGFLLCNGAKIDITSNPEYTNLKNVIQEYWGDCNDGLSNTINLPDLRGIFLRGVNMNGSSDPDVADRTSIHAGGSPGNHVGSYQEYQLQTHTHLVTPEVASSDSGGGYVTSGSPVASSIAFYTNATGGNETRPKNAYVQYIIKY